METSITKNIPVLNAIVRALLAPFKHSRLLIKKLIIPVALLFGLIHITIELFLGNLTFMSMFFSYPLPVAILLSVTVYFSFFALLAMIAVNTHRTFLLEEPQKLKVVWFSARELRFAGWLLALGFIYNFIDNAATKISENIFSSGDAEKYSIYVITAVQWSILLIPVYFWSRLCLVYPATAIDKRPSLSDAWGWSKNQSFRIFIIVCLFPTLVAVGMVLLLVKGINPESDGMALLLSSLSKHAISAIVTGIVLVAFIIEVAAISLTLLRTK